MIALPKAICNASNSAEVMYVCWFKRRKNIRNEQFALFVPIILDTLLLSKLFD